MSDSPPPEPWWFLVGVAILAGIEGLIMFWLLIGMLNAN
jgi:hypothetical protein